MSSKRSMTACSHPPRPYQSVLGRLQPIRPDTDLLKRDGWINHRILVIHRDDPNLDMIEREIVSRIGTRLFGPCKPERK